MVETKYIFTDCAPPEFVNVLSNQSIWLGGIPYGFESDSLKDSTVILPESDNRIIAYLDYFCSKHLLITVRLSA